MKKNIWKRKIFIAIIVGVTISSVFPVMGEQEQIIGWKKEKNGWVYLSSDGSKIVNQWIKENKNAYYYLNENGYVVKNSIIRDGDGIYYVDETGNRVRNQWASESNAESEDPCDQEIQTLWYYFGADGKARCTEGKALHYQIDGVDNKYFFDSDGHMLSGWQWISGNVYYLGEESDGHVHLRWQDLAPDEEFIQNASEHSYDSLERFYFGWDGDMTKGKQSKLGEGTYLFDENGVMLVGWQTENSEEHGSEIEGLHCYYDENTGKRAEGWLYTYDPNLGQDGEAYWFYCDKKKGWPFNENGKDGDGGLGFKKINDQTYFFDENGHMIYGLIATDGTDLGDNPFVESEFEEVSGDIGVGLSAKPAGIYYLNKDEKKLGQMEKSGALKLQDNSEKYEYYLSSCGKAYTNAFIKGNIYGEDGLKWKSDSGNDVFFVKEDIYEKDAFVDATIPEDSSEKPIIPAGNQVIINKAGTLKKNGKVKIQGREYIVKNYLVVSEK